MSKIKGKNTKPEILVRKFLFSRGFRFRIHDSRYPGKPDIVLPKYNTVIFVHGCFWHGHEECKAALLPETNKPFWKKKIYGNMERDRKITQILRDQGWNVIILWDCEIDNERKKEKRLSLLLKEILGTI